MKTSRKDIKALKHLLKDDSHSKHYLKIEITKNILPHIFDEETKEETFVITREQIFEFHKHGTFETKQQAVSWFPSAFVEDKKELVLESGKWYVGYHFGNRFLTCLNLTNEIEAHNEGFGFNKYNEWTNDLYFLKTFDYGFELATPEEVKEALTKEGVKRGFKENVFVKDLGNTQDGRFYYNSDLNYLYCGSYAAFCNGTWNEIITTLTKSEAEQKLNCKII